MNSKIQALFLIGSVMLNACSKHEDPRRITARHLAGLCNALVGYYENNASFPDTFDLLTKDPKGREWGGGIFQIAPGGTPIRLVLVETNSISIELNEKGGSRQGTPEWVYTLRLDTATPTNHVWRILIISAPDKASAIQELEKREIMKTSDWIYPKRNIKCTIELSSTQ